MVQTGLTGSLVILPPTAALDGALVGEVFSAEELSEALRDERALEAEVPKKISDPSFRPWLLAVSRARQNAFYISARIVVEKKSDAKARAQAAVTLSKLVREEAIPLRSALGFTWSLAQYSNEPWLKIVAMKNFSRLFMMMIRPFLLGNRWLVFPPVQNIWEEKFVSRAITGLKRMASDRRNDRLLRAMAQKLLMQLERVAKPKGVLARQLAEKQKRGLPGIHQREFCVATTGFDQSELKKRKVDRKSNGLFPLSMDQLYPICRQFRTRMEYWASHGTGHLRYYKATFDRVEKGYQRKDRREFFIGIATILGLIINQ